MSLLVSTKIYATRGGATLGAATRVARDWRVVMVPDDNNSMDILGLYNGIGSHTFDQLEPFVAFEGDKSVRAQVGRSQTSQDYQDIPLSVKVADAAGIYFQVFCMLEDAPCDNQQDTETPRDACKVLKHSDQLAVLEFK